MTLFLTGCQSAQLRERTTQQARTVTDVYYQQVLDNLAMLHDNPALLPYFSVAGTGLDGVQLTGGLNYTLNWDLITNGVPRFIGRYLFDKQAAAAMGSEAITEQWTTATDPYDDDLTMMRCAYLRALGFCDTDCCKRLLAFLGGDSPYLPALQPGWFQIGKKCDVPKFACYVGHHCDTYAWVLPGDVQYLSWFTLIILDIVASETLTREDADAARIKELEDHSKNLLSLLTADKEKTMLSKPQIEFLQKEFSRAVDGIHYRTLSQERRRYKDLLDQLRFCPETADEVAKGYYAKRAAARLGIKDTEVNSANVRDILSQAIAHVEGDIGALQPGARQPFPVPSREAPRLKRNFFNPYAVPGIQAVP